ncbi:MAG: acyl-CoA dehydrogenase, partial [bacterium]|nr:acyl-CoA dehydrogenase [bacterium]
MSKNPIGAGATDPHDFLEIDAELTGDERLLRDTVRQFVGDRILPNVAEWFEEGYVPRELAKEMGSLGLFGMHLDGYGCAGMSAVDYGLACLELEAGDSGTRSFVSVQGSLAMFPIWAFGSEEQKERWLPGMAAGDLVGCFGLTEPDSGSDPSSMRTVANKDGDDWVLNGTKMWITNGSISDVAVVWAQSDGGILGFIVPTDTPGFSSQDIHHKLSLRASFTSELIMDNVRLPADAVLPGVTGIKGPLSCLSEARYGILWGAVGAARACYEAALDYSKEREQFGGPIGRFQLTQRKLVEMLVSVNRGMLLALHLGRKKDAGTLQAAHISFGKLDNVRMALEVAR